jgi:uncharacterized damage-inducible protein DinB
MLFGGSMNKHTILTLFQYNVWSTTRILNVASNITREQFLAPVPFPHGSLRGTLVHALFAEWIWRMRWQGTPSANKWNPENFLTFDSLRTRWAEETPRLLDFMTNVTEERLYKKIKYVSTEGFSHERVLWETMLHLVNHGTQHKTEAAAILTSLGHSPGDLDLIVYLNEGN